MDKSDKNKPSANPPTKPKEESLDDTTTTQEDGDSPSAAPVEDKKADASSGKKSPLSHITESRYLYIVVFAMLVIIASIVVLASTKWKNNTKQPEAAKKLTASELSTISANTTSVGSANETLDVQSNAIFDNQVLLKKDLAIAGSLKLGGSLSLPTIDVSGNGNFDQVQINKTLSVAGDAVVQGQLNLQKNLTVVGSATFGSLSASQISVTNFQLNGDLNVAHHIVASGALPSKSNGSGLGNGGTVSSAGSDTAGTITINTGSSPSLGCFVTVNFAQKFNTTPHVVVSPSNSSSGSLDYYTNRSATNFSLCSANTPAAGTTYIFDYVVIY